MSYGPPRDDANNVSGLDLKNHLEPSPGNGSSDELLSIEIFLDPDTEEERPLLQDDSTVKIIHFFSSPDGKRVVFDGSVRSQSGLWVITLADHSIKSIAKAGLRPWGWSSDGNSIYATDESNTSDKTNILLVPASGGDPRILLSLTGGETGMSVSPDGRKVVYGVEEYKTDVWLGENFDPAHKK